jgi:predicted RNA-binding protein with PUA domain
MADTFGGLVDKLTTVDLKMWNNQEIFYAIRKMSFDEFKNKYFKSEDGAKELWQTFQKAIDLNIQRNELIDELDEKLIDMINSAIAGEELDNGKYIQRKHKTY